MDKKHPGVLGIEYHESRKNNRALKYRLERRSFEVIRAIKKYYHSPINAILDIGTADGLMFGILKQRLEISTYVGLDRSLKLLQTNKYNTLKAVQADAHQLPFLVNTFDIVIATAVIEHISSAKIMIKECYRILRKDGLCIVTTPVPFFEQIAVKIGHLKMDEHVDTFDLKKLKLIFITNNFRVIEADKFMISPVGFLGEIIIEKVIKKFGFSFLLLNQIIVCKKG